MSDASDPHLLLLCFPSDWRSACFALGRLGMRNASTQSCLCSLCILLKESPQSRKVPTEGRHSELWVSRDALSGGQSLLSDGLWRTLQTNWIQHTPVCCPAEIPLEQEGDCNFATSQLKTNSHPWSLSVSMGKSVKQRLLNVPFSLTHGSKDFLSRTFPVSLNRMICPSLCPQDTVFVYSINGLSRSNSDYVFLSLSPTGLWDSSRQELHEHTHRHMYAFECVFSGRFNSPWDFGLNDCHIGLWCCHNVSKFS